MSNYTLQDLANLGEPEIIETLDVEAILARRKAALVDLGPKYGLNYDTTGLETEPGVILLEESAYEEVYLRARGNDIARDAYLYWARGAGLDHKGAFYDCLRMPGELDDRYIQRIILAIQGRSTGGTIPRYQFVAMSASLRVSGVSVYTLPPSPQVNFAILSADNNGIADQALLDTVRAAVNDPSVRMVNDNLSVRAAVVQVVDVVADLWLLPATLTSVVSDLQNTLAAKWTAVGDLGRDLTQSWLVANLMAPGVERVSLIAPSTDAVVKPYEAVRIGNVTLNLRGRAY